MSWSVPWKEAQTGDGPGNSKTCHTDMSIVSGAVSDQSGGGVI